MQGRKPPPTFPPSKVTSRSASPLDSILAILPGVAQEAAQAALESVAGDPEMAIDGLLKLQFSQLLESAGDAEEEEDEEQIKAETFHVPPPDAEISAFGSTEEGHQSRSQVVATSADDIIAASGRKKALLIGVNYFGSKHELRGCVADVKRVKDLITTAYRFPTSPNHLTVLTDDNSDHRFHPTKINIIYAMKWLVAGAKEGDCLFFHFSGHGSKQLDESSQEDDGYDETILPCDYKTQGMIVDDIINDELVMPLPAGVKLTAIFDCCHSGTGMDLPFTAKASHKIWESDPCPKLAEADVLLISGCMDDQTSADLSCATWGAGGAMSFALVGALASQPRGHTYVSLLSQLQQSMTARGFTQIPQMSSTQQFDLHRSFSIDSDIIPNLNKVRGREGHRQKKRVPKDAERRRRRGGVARRLKLWAWDLSDSSEEEQEN